MCEYFVLEISLPVTKASRSRCEDLLVQRPGCHFN